MGCDCNCNDSCKMCKDGKMCIGCGIERVLKFLIKIAKITALSGLTLVLFDIHTGLKAQFEGMQAQQAMMMNAATANAPAK
jgi:hypothetical protein